MLRCSGRQAPPSPPTKQLSPARAKPAPLSLPSPAPRRARGRRWGRGQGRQSAPGRTKPPPRSSSRGRAKGNAENTEAAPARPVGKCGHRRELPAGITPAGSRDFAHPSPRAPAPGARATKCPLPGSAPAPQPQHRSQQWAPAARRGSERRPGPNRRRGPGAAAPARPTCLPPPARNGQRQLRPPHRKAGLTFPEPARRGHRRAFAFGKHGLQRRGRRASSPPPPPLPLRLLPSCPAPGPLPPALARTLARALLAALPPSPRRWLRALSSCQKASAPAAAPSPWEPRRLRPGVPVPPPPPLARRPGCPLAHLARRRTRLRLRRPLRLLHRCRRRRRWSTWSSTERGYPGEGIEAGVNVPRLIGASAVCAGAGPGRPGRDALSAPNRGGPLRPPPRNRCPASAGELGVSAGASLCFL